MSHELESTNGRVNFAALDKAWHFGSTQHQLMKEGQSVEEWLRASGLDFPVSKVQAYKPDGAGGFVAVPDSYFVQRDDTGHVFGQSVTDVYKLYTGMDIGAFFADYVLTDPRFGLEAAGAIRQGDKLWMSARFKDDMTVGGLRHRMRILLCTSLDCSMATIAKPVAECVVCQNTMNIALAEPQSMVKVRHTSKVDHAKVAVELARITSGYERFKVMGDALAQVVTTREQVVAFFKEMAGIKADARKEDVPTRTMNVYEDLWGAYRTSMSERGEVANGHGNAFAMLQAITRHTTHDRTVRNVADYAGGEAEARFASNSLGGSGEAMTAKAWGLLMPLIKDRVAA